MFFLLSLVSADAKTGTIVKLTMENWKQNIEKRDPNSVWFVMFTSASSPACQIFHPIFEAAASHSHGMINFGEIRADLEAGIETRFQIKYLPTFIIFHKDGETEYNGKRTYRAMINACARLIPDQSNQIEISWLNDGLDSALLFTDKNSTPFMWRAVSCALKGKIRIGVSNNQELSQKFGVKEFPEIHFINQTNKIVYTGKYSYPNIREAILEFSEGRYKIPFQFNPDFFLPEEFNLENQQFTGYSVVIVTDELHPDIRAVKNIFTNKRVKYFYGTEDLPYPFMKPNDIWILFQRKKMGLLAKNANELKIILTQIFDGTVVWKPLSDNYDITSSL